MFGLRLLVCIGVLAGAVTERMAAQDSGSDASSSTGTDASSTASVGSSDSDASPAIGIPPDDAVDLDDPSATPETAAAQTSSTVLPVPENNYPALRQLLDAALVGAPRILAQKSQDAVAEGNRLVARSGLLPDVTASMAVQGRNEERLRTAAATKTVPAHDYWKHNVSTRSGYGLNIAQPLYYWGALRNVARIGRLQEQVSVERTTDEYRSLVQDLRSRYLQAVILRVTRDRAVYFRQQQEKEATRLEAKLASNAVSRSQIRRQQLNVELAQLAEDRAQEDFRRYKLALARAAGLPNLDDTAIPDVVQPVGFDLAALQNLTKNFLGDVAGRAANLSILRHQIDIEKLNYRNAQVRLRPNVSLSAGYSQDSQNYGNTDYNPYGVAALYAGVTVNWSIFDGFAAKGAKMSALARRRELERIYDATVRDIADNCQSRLKAVEFARRNMSISDRLLNASERAVDRAKSRVKDGLAADSNVDDAQLALFDARISCYSARADCLNKVTALLSTIFEDPALTNLDRATP